MQADKNRTGGDGEATYSPSDLVLIDYDDEGQLRMTGSANSIFVFGSELQRIATSGVTAESTLAAAGKGPRGPIQSISIHITPSSSAVLHYETAATSVAGTGSNLFGYGCLAAMFTVAFWCLIIVLYVAFQLMEL